MDITVSDLTALVNVIQRGNYDLATAVKDGNAQSVNVMTQGFSGLNTAIKECCCETQKLVQQQALDGARDDLCQSRAEVAALKAQLFQTGQSAHIIESVVAHIKAK